MPSDVTLTSALRNYLQSLQKTKGTENTCSARMQDPVPGSPESISQAAQDFCTRTLGAQASELTSRMEDISNSIKTLEQASLDISELLGLVTNAELIALAAQSALDVDENADVGKFENTLETVVENVTSLIQKGSYKNVTEKGQLLEKGQMLENVSLSSPSSISGSIDIIRDIFDETQSLRTTIADDLSTIRTVQDFTQGTISALEVGKKEINIVDLNEEGANLMALQTRMALGSSSSLSLASSTQEEVLRLF